MNVLYACDDKFVKILAVSLRSLYQHNNEVNVLLLGNSISNQNKKLLEDISEKYSTKKIIIKKSCDIEKILSYPLKKDRGSVAQFSRLFFEKSLPASWDKLIYLDCDTIILHSLKELWEQQLGQAVVGGVLDAFSYLNYKALGLSEDNILINSGVLLINVCKWRELLIEQKIVSYIKCCKGYIFQGDQGIINFVLSDYICKLPLKYNVVEYLYDFTYKEILIYRKPLKYYTPKQVERAKNKPIIVHFTTSFATVRPWEGKSNNPYYNYWYKLYDEIYENRNVSLPAKLSFIKKTIMRILQFKHSYVFLAFIGIVHGYVRPSIYVLKSRFLYP